MIAWQRWILPGLTGVTLLTAAALATTGRDLAADIAARVDAELSAAGQSWASAEVDGRTVTIMGTAPTQMAQRVAVEAAGRIAGVFDVIDGSGLLPLQADYQWSAERSDDGITLSGYVPSEDARLALLSAARQLAPEATIADHMSLARGQPVDFLGLAQFALARLAEMSDGTVSLAGPALSISGAAASEQSFAAAAAALSGGVPPSGELRNVRVLPPRTERFTWRAEFDGRTVRMSGFVPSQQVRRDIAAAIGATSTGTLIEDQTHLASGAPEGFGSAAVFGAFQIARLAEATITLDGLTLSIEGKARTVEDYQAALAEIDARRDVRGSGITIGSVDIVPAFVDPYIWRAERDGSAVTLSGYMPTDDVHEQILRLATELFPGSTVVDHVRVAAGDPKMDWIGASTFSLRQLALLGKGAVSLTGPAYDIVGEAASTSAYEQLDDALGKTLPSSMELRRSEVSPAAVSPFVFSAVRQADELTLSGYVPTREMAAAIADRARRRFAGEGVEMRVQLAGGAPEGLVEAADAGLQAISRLDGGRVDLVDRKLTISGVAVSEGAQRQIEADLRAALPPGFEPTVSVMLAVGGNPLTGPECQAALTAEFERNKIAFDNASAEIRPESYGLIDRAAAIIQRCPAATIEVAGHTDSGGGSRKNQALSEDRAEAVVERLVEDGVRRERLTAIGYGEARRSEGSKANRPLRNRDGVLAAAILAVPACRAGARADRRRLERGAATAAAWPEAPAMIVHAAELWGLLAACFLVGCLAGTVVVRSLRWIGTALYGRLTKSLGRDRLAGAGEGPVPLPSVVPVRPPEIRRFSGTSPDGAPGAPSARRPGRIAPSRPLPLPGPRRGRSDDLLAIEGLEKRHVSRLAAIGIYHFSQIAAWTPQEIAYVARHLDLGETIAERDWPGQAARLAGEAAAAPEPDSRRGAWRKGRQARPAGVPSDETVDKADDR